MSVLNLLTTVTFAGLLSWGSVANAVPFTNGDFSAGLTGWNTLAGNGSVAVVSGVAELDTGPGTDPFSASLIQGDDGSFSFSSPITLGVTDFFLIFDVEFVDLGFEDEGGPGLFTDGLAAALFDALDFTLDLLFGVVADLTDPGPKQVVLDVSSLAGRDVALSFDIADEADNRNSRARIDNVRFAETAPAAVPEPSMLSTIGLGLAVTWLAGIRRRRSLG